MKNHNPFRYFKTSPEIIRLAVMMYVRFPLSLRNVEDLLHERGIDPKEIGELISRAIIEYGTVRLKSTLTMSQHSHNVLG